MRSFNSVSRRKFLPAAGAAVAATTLAAPAIAQEAPAIKWRLTASYPKSLDTLFGAVNTIARVTSELTDGNAFHETVDAVVAAIESAMAGVAAAARRP